MPTNETVVEIVRFTEKGLDEVSAKTKVFGQQIDEASKKQKVLLGLLNDSRYQRHVAQLDAINRQHELGVLKLRNQALAHSIADGSAAKHLRTVTKLNEQHERMRREVELTAKYGEKLGGFLARHGQTLAKFGSIGGGILTAGATAGAALARQGFSGTVEGARADYERHRLSRELAGINKPAKEAESLTYRWFRERSERLGSNGQNAVMIGEGLGLGYGAYRAYGFLSRLGGTTAATGAGAEGAGAASVAGRAGLAGRLGMAARSPYALAALIPILEGLHHGTHALARGGSWRDFGAEAMRGNYTFGTDIIGMDPMRWGMRQVGLEDSLMRGRESQAKALGLSTFERPPVQDVPPNPNRRQVQVSGGGFDEGGSGYDRIVAAIDVGGGGSQAEAMPEWARTIGAAVDRLTNWLDQNERSQTPPLRRPGDG